MKILKIHHIENYARCKKCEAELQFDNEDLHWDKYKPDYYYVVCPVCFEKIWLKRNEELDEKYNYNSKTNIL